MLTQLLDHLVRRTVFTWVVKYEVKVLYVTLWFYFSVTGASFVVFNGALKTSSGLTAKSSIVEDGLMVQITPDSMAALKQAIKDMHDYPINCGIIGAQKPDETVIVQWTEDDKNVNIG